MRIRFYLKRADSKSDTSIYALVNYEGNQSKIYTGESILPKYWNSDTQSARNTPKFTEHPEFNERLNQIRSTINRTFLDFRNTSNGATPSPAVFKSLVESAMKRGGQKMTLFNYFEDFIKRTTNGQRMNPKSKKPVRPTVVRGYQYTLNLLKEFGRTTRRKPDFDTIDLEFHNEFTKYLTSAPILLSANTIGSHIQRIKAVLSEATEKGMNNNLAFKSRFFVKQSEDSDNIYLSETELKELQKLDLSETPRLDNVRDSFLIGCYTGLRFSDFSVIKPKNIEEGIIKINQVKTGNPVVIPVHRVVAQIIKKHSGKIPPGISNEKFNEYLKEVGQRVESLKKTESKTITKGGTKVVRNVEKWELLTTHTARRTFSTNEFLAGTPSITIMAITGHRSEKSFLKYIRVNQDEHAKSIAKLWEQRERKSKLKAV